jgi:two-component system OmpR family sensor kinase
MTLSILHSLRARLLFFLLAAILLTAVVQGGVAYRGALTQADEIFDYHLQRTAFSLSAGNPIANMQGNDEAGEVPEDRDLVIQVWTPDGVRVFRSAPRLPLPDRTVLGFSDLEWQGATYRVFSLQTRSQVIQVAQDMAVRTGMARTLALRAVWPIAALAPLLMLVVGWVISVSLRPVDRARRQVATRQANDLSPIGDQGLPDEVRPLVHELNLLLSRVQDAFATQKRFVGDAAHELRSPLAALKLQIQSLQRATDDAARDTATRRLAAGIDRATHLVEQLLLLARQEGGPAPAAQMPSTSLRDAVGVAIADVLPLAQAGDINLGVVDDPAADPVVNAKGDMDSVPLPRDELVVLVRNLIDNAVKYTPGPGRVDVGISRTAPTPHASATPGVTLTVDDSGPGIPDTERQRVFDRFYRASDATGVGSGLGLAIVKAIADRHGATILLDRSPTLGGLRVQVIFPLP